jgi:hypothetical protein
MYENHFSIKLISFENLYIMTTMTHIQKFKQNSVTEYGISNYVILLNNSLNGKKQILHL